MRYEFKWNEELVWLVLTTAGLEIAQLLYTFDPSSITDWRSWAVSFGGACVRAVAGAILSLRNRP